MSDDKTVYPDISDILARKERGRRDLASLSFDEKLKILEEMREHLEPMRRAREARLEQLAWSGEQSRG
jgi:hypothetical protein